MDQNFIHRGFTEVFDVSFDDELSNLQKLIYYAEDKIKNKEYFPGFFITIGRRI